MAEHTHNVASLTAARRLADHVRENPPHTLAVVGGGLTGVEVATEFAESHPDLRVELITRGRVGAGAVTEAATTCDGPWTALEWPCANTPR